MKLIAYFLALIFALVNSFMLAACSKSSESQSVSNSTKVQSSDGQDLNRQANSKDANQEQEIFNKNIYDLESVKVMSDTSTRDGDSKYQKAQDDLNILRESIVGKKVTDWVCIAFRPLGPIDLSMQISSSERDGQKTSEVICSANQHEKFTNNLNEMVKQEITLSIYEDSAKKIGKLFNNDILKFSGVVQDFSSRGPNKYYMRIDVESIKSPNPNKPHFKIGDKHEHEKNIFNCSLVDNWN